MLRVSRRSSISSPTHPRPRRWRPALADLRNSRAAHRPRRAQVPGIGDRQRREQPRARRDDLRRYAEAHVGKAHRDQRALSSPRRGRMGRFSEPFATLTIVVIRSRGSGFIRMANTMGPRKVNPIGLRGRYLTVPGMRCCTPASTSTASCSIEDMRSQELMKDSQAGRGVEDRASSGPQRTKK